MKGLHQVTRKLADGSTRQHFYAWRGGPRMDAAPGTPEFVAEFQRLTADRLKPLRSDGTFQAWINEYQRLPAFLSLRKATRDGYVRRIKLIEAEFGAMPQAVLHDPRVRGDFLDWRG